jgi:hypothetical protein
MLDWTEVQKTIKSFLKSEVLGSGYVDEYYDSFAYTLTEYLKVLDEPKEPSSVPAHELPTIKNWGVAWFGKTGQNGSCERCGRARRVYQGYNGGAHVGLFCAECQGAVLRNEA